MYNFVEIEELVGKTFTSVRNLNNEELVFSGPEGSYKFFHYQDCCESVYIEDVCGDLEDLVDTPILVAEERTSGNFEDPDRDACYDDYVLWTFYEFRTIKGSVTVRWFGESNGYYSVDVTFEEIDNG